MTTTNTISSAFSQAFSNPKAVAKAAYFFFVVFGTFQLTRLLSSVAISRLLSSYSKPNLVKETSKIHTRNYALIPFIMARKFFL
jgi:hypothetical protein